MLTLTIVVCKANPTQTDFFFPQRQESDDNNSHENKHEAELLIGLCRHLMLQGYGPEEVTILTTYSGQFFLLRKVGRHAVCMGHI